MTDTGTGRQTLGSRRGRARRRPLPARALVAEAERLGVEQLGEDLQ